MNNKVAQAQQTDTDPSCASQTEKAKIHHEPTSKTRFMSSLFSTMVAVTVWAPFDVLKTRLQVQKDKAKVADNYSKVHLSFIKIAKEEGMKGLFRGYKVTLMTTPLFHSIYFPVYERLRIELAKQFHVEKYNPKVVSLSSAMTGILWNIITNPLWLVRVRMQAEIFRESSYTTLDKTINRKSVWATLYRIYKREGFFALYTGLAASMMGISHVAIYFPLYEQFKLHFKRKYDQTDSTLSSKYVLWSSVSAKLMTSWITYPHEVVRARQQDTRSYDNASPYLKDVIKRTFNKEGFRGFYHGFSLNLMRMLPQNAIVFLLYEYFSQILR